MRLSEEIERALFEGGALTAVDLSKTLNSLIKYNGGEWKSDRQARYLLKQLKGSFFSNDHVKLWARRQGFTGSDVVPVEVMTSLGYARQDPSKARYLVQVFVLDSGGVLARAKMRYRHFRKGAEAEEGIDWSSGEITFKREGDSSVQVDLEAERLANLEKFKDLIEKIKTVPNWEGLSILRSFLAQLEDGRELSPRQLQALNKFLPRESAKVELGDKGQWEQDFFRFTKLLANKVMPWLPDIIFTRSTRHPGRGGPPELGELTSDMTSAINEVNSYKGGEASPKTEFWVATAMSALAANVGTHFWSPGQGHLDEIHDEIMTKAVKRKSPTKSAMKTVSWIARAIQVMERTSKERFISRFDAEL